MNEHLLLTRFQKACTDLHDGKVKTRKQAIEDISNLLDNPNLIMCLNRRASEWNNTFVAVKTLFYREMGKLEEEIAKKGQIGPRPSAFPCECRDLLHTVVKNANAKHGIISFPDYYSYVAKCRENAVFKRYCLESSLTVFDYYFLMRDSYWDKITLDQITEMKDFFKSLHLENPSSKALRCYKTLLQKGADYKLPIAVVKGEIDFVKFVVRELNGSTRWLLECAAQLFLVFCQCCRESYRQMCIAEGENLLCYLFCFYNPNECVHDFRASLLEIMLIQLEYHEHVEFTTKWREALMHMGGFIKSCVDTNDRLVMTESADGIKFCAKFVAAAQLCYKQSLEAKQRAVVDETRAKRPRQEVTFLEIFDYLENNLQGPWILLFSLIFEKYPQLLPQHRFETLLRAFSSYVKDSSSITIRGYVYKWLCNLIHIEERLVAQNGEYSTKSNESEWLLVYDSATRSIGLNQNTKESHNLLQLIISKKHEMLSAEDAAKLGNLYRSQAIHLSEASLRTFHAFAQHLGPRASVEHAPMIDAILGGGDASANFACAITADVLVNLAFKHYTHAHKAAAQSASVFNRRSHDHLFAILREIMARTLEKDCDKLLELVHLFTNMLRCYGKYNLDVDELLNEVRAFIDRAWIKLKAFFEGFLAIGVEQRTKTLNILKGILRADETLGIISRTIEFWFVEEMAKAQCELDTDYLPLTHPDVRLKLLIVETFTIFAAKCDTEAQRNVQVMLYEFEDFDPCSDVDYQQAAIILDALANENCSLCLDSVTHLINLIKKVCQKRVNEYAVCARMLRALAHAFRHLFAMPDLTDDVKSEYLRVYDNLHRMRKNYGYRVELALVECLRALLEPRRSLTWASYDGEAFVKKLLPGFLKSENQEVKREAIGTLSLVFEHPSTNSETDRLKSDILRRVLDAFVLDQPAGDDPHGIECFQDNVLDFLAKVVVSARGTKFTKRALGEMFVLTKKFDIPLDKVREVLKHLEGHVEIKSHANIVLQFWCKSYPIVEFPYSLLGADSLSGFYSQYLPFIVLIVLRSNDEETLEVICSQIGRSESDVIEECYPKFIANNLIEQCLQEGRGRGAGGGDDTTMGNIARLTQVKLQELVPSDRSKNLLKLTIDEVLVEVIKYIHDPVHFEQFFQYNVCIPNLETTTISYEKFKDIVKSLSDDLAMDVVKFICEIKPAKIQQVLLKLKLNFWEKHNNEDKMIAFYHYALFVDCVLRHEINEALVIFILRDVIYNNINLIKYSAEAADEEDVIRTLALKFMSGFVKLVLEKYSKRFAEFLIVVCSTMLPFAALGNSDARRVLERILFSDDEHITNQLKYLDPLPDDNAHLRDLRARHLQFRMKDASLQSEIDLFLSGAQCKESRVEGLKHLRSRLKTNQPALKSIYLKLHEMRGILAKKSALHDLIAALVVLVRSKDEKESLEAARCLGILGASDLTTMVLKSEDLVQTKDDSSYLFTSKVVELLNELLVDRNLDVVRCASVAMYAVLSTADGRHIVRNDVAFAKIRGVFIPFVANGKDRSLLAVTRELREETLTDEALWCGQRMTHEQWVTSLTTKILEGCQHDVMKCLIPIVTKKASFAETIFPFLINLLLDAGEDVKSSVGLCIKTFFGKHWAGATDTVTLNIASVKCLLNTLHFVRLQRLCDKRGKYRELDLDLDYLHVAKAAGFCSAHFSALMYAEKWYHVSVRNSAKTSSHTLSPIGFLDEIGEETSQLRFVLSRAYEGIGDTNALHGGHLDGLEPQTELGHAHRDQSQYFQLLRNDLLLSSSARAPGQMTRIFRDCAFYNLAISTANIHSDHTDVYYECMWRMAQWDVPSHDAPSANSFEFNVYNLLNAINDDDRAIFDSWAQKTRRQVADSLKSVSLESCKTLYGSLSELERLQELEDVFTAIKDGADLKALAEGFLRRDEIQSDFKYWEPRMAQRIEAMNLLRRRGCENAADVYVEMNLRYADLSREHGNLQISKRALSKFVSVDDPEVKAKVELLDARIDWKLGHTSSIAKLKKLLKTYEPQTRLRSSILKLCGEWMVENKSEFPQKILRDYFLPCVAILNNQDGDGGQIDHSEFDMIHDVYNTLAKFADEEYQHISRSIKSPEFARKVASMNKMIGTANKLKALPNMSRDVKKAIVTYERLTKIDEIDVKAKHAERDTFLKVAIKYYLFNMKYSTEVQAEIFRIFSLWLENKNNDAVHAEIEEKLLQIESYKILTMLPQLVPHISIENDRFSKCINLLIENCAKQHPHHAIPLILSVANTNKDDHYSKENAKTASNESRIAGASELVDRLREMPELKTTVEQNESLATALIELAYFKAKPNEGSITKIPRTLQVYGIKDYAAALVPTYNLPYRPSLNYKSIVGVHKFKQEFGNVGGVNAPKRLECVGTDGVARYLLVKGQDDMRQDAVMQQVFVIMNELLRANKETLNFTIRTYKVVPLSKRSGVLEWVSDSMPIGEYLADAHAHYHPRDKKMDKARLEIKDAVPKGPQVRLRTFLNICEKIHPVFHKFFETNFLQPTVWYERRKAYTQSVAVSSMCGFVLGIGDRHVKNILVDKTTAEVVHIDFGIAFEMGKILPTPETVPFRLTRDFVDGMGVCGVEGTFRKTCEQTMEVLRRNVITIQTIVEVLLYDPLYDWSITPTQAYSKQLDDDSKNDSQFFTSDDDAETNVSAERALARLRHRLLGTDSGSNTSVETQVDRLIQQAREPSNLSKLFYGWQAYL